MLVIAGERVRGSVARLEWRARAGGVVWGVGPITDALDGTSMDIDWVRIWRRR